MEISGSEGVESELDEKCSLLFGGDFNAWKHGRRSKYG